MKAGKIIEALQKIAPEEIACSWDNPGLLVGSRDTEVQKILITVDVTKGAIDMAIHEGAQMILSHHPLIFSGMKKLNDDDVFGSRLLTLIQNGICVYAMHTNYDMAAGGMAEMAAARLNLADVEPLTDAVTYTDPDGNEKKGGLGAVGNLTYSNYITGSDFVDILKDAFEREQLVVFGEDWMDRKISRVAICPGSGKDEIEAALASGADVYVSGDIGHHAGLDAGEQGLMVVDAGHYGVEQIFVEDMQEKIRDVLPEGPETVGYLEEPFLIV